MKALSLWQPYATAVAYGVKKIETRHWATIYRGPIAIHAAKRWNADQKFFAATEHTLGRLPRRIPLGAIVAFAKIVDCRLTDELEVSPIERIYGNYGVRRFGWVLDEVYRLPAPIPYAGRQGLFDIPDSVVEGQVAIPANVPFQDE